MFQLRESHFRRESVTFPEVVNAFNLQELTCKDCLYPLAPFSDLGVKDAISFDGFVANIPSQQLATMR